MKKQAVYFESPFRVEVREELLEEPGPHELVVKTIASAISAGTELLVYRGEAPHGMPADETIACLTGTFGYPMKYGYAVIGEVVGGGAGITGDWLGRRVFVFHPHESHFNAAVDEVQIVPSGMSVEEALFFPSMETAITLALDGKGGVGEQIAVFGQGIIGLLLTALLAELPLARLVTFDACPMRRRISLDVGAHYSLDPGSPRVIEEAISLLRGENPYRGADLTYEVSGNPNALDQAVAITGYNGRVVIGSWYGSKEVRLDLGGRFHRSRMRLVSSQVSSVDPELRGRWNKDRLRRLSWNMLNQVKPARFVTHRFHLSGVRAAYELLDKEPGTALQVLLDY